MSKKIVVDTREQIPYSFGFFKSPDDEVITHKLEYGDYSLVGLEDKIVIERKASPAELAQNFGRDKARFYREMEALKSFDHAVFLCEFTMEDVLAFPAGQRGLPKYLRGKVRIKGKYLVKCLNQLEEEYGLDVVYAGDAMTAEQWAFDFLTCKASLYARDLSDLDE